MIGVTRDPIVLEKVELGPGRGDGVKVTKLAGSSSCPIGEGVMLAGNIVGETDSEDMPGDVSGNKRMG
jgi:hypothetical protein